MTLNNLIELWLAEKKKAGLKARSEMRYREIIRVHITNDLGKKKVTELAAWELEDFQQMKLLCGNVRNGKGLAVNTVKSVMQIVKAAVDFGKRRYGLNVCDTRDIAVLKSNEKTVDAFSKEEQRKIENIVRADGRSNHYGIIICLYTGLRLGELLALEWEDIDFKTGLLTVNKTASFFKDEGGIYEKRVERPKTSSSVRTIPLPRLMLSELSKLKKKSKSRFIVSTHKGGRVINRSYQTTYSKLLERAGVKYRNFHSLRHTFATRAIECGMDFKTLSEIMGHKSPQITMNRYVHSMMDTKIKMMNLIERKLNIDS